MRSYADELESFRKIRGALADLATATDFRHPGKCIFDRVLGYLEAFGETARFRVDDRVELAVTPDVSSPGHGWAGYKHMLVEGAAGQIVQVDWYDGWVYLWQPDRQTWIDVDGVERQSKRPSSFMFREDRLRPILRAEVPEEPQVSTG